MLSILALLHNTWHPIVIKSPSLSFQYTSVLFDQEHGGTYSYSFDLDIDANIAIFGNTPDITGMSIYRALNGILARITLSGVPIIDGVFHLEPNVEVKHSDGRRQISISVENSKKSFDKQIAGARLRDLTIGMPPEGISEELRALYDTILIGRSLPINLEFTAFYKIQHFLSRDGILWQVDYDKKDEFHVVDQSISLPHLLFPKYEDTEMNGQYSIDAVNVSMPYDPADRTRNPYCNVRVCYQKYTKNDDNEWEAARGYSIGTPDRLNSAPCFYLGYVFDKAMHDLGIAVRQNDLTSIMDYRRLAFYHTDAHYDIEQIRHHPEGSNRSTIVPFANGGINKFKIKAGYYSGQQYGGNNSFVYKEDNGVLYRKTYFICDSDGNKVHRNHKDDDSVSGIIQVQYPLCNAYATADNLPDLEVKDLIEDMTSLFGARIIYDESLQSLSIVMLRDIMRRANAPIVIPCDINSVHKQESAIHGCVLKYSGSKAQTYNSVTKVPNDSQGSDDTAYNYYGYKNIVLLSPIDTPSTTVPSASPEGSTAPVPDASPSGNNGTYLSLIASPSCFDMNLYIDQATGNAFRIKVDGSADTQTVWFASTFEIAGYRDVLVGDCSSLSLPESEREDTNVIKTVTIPFTPAIPSIVNQGDIRDAISTSDEIPHPIYAQFVSGEIHHNEDDSLIKHNYEYGGIVLAEEYSVKEHRTVTTCHMDVLLNLEVVEDYDVTNSSDGPYYDTECENTLGIMRGSGAGESVIYFNENYDGFGTAEYTITAGSDAEFTSDSVNHFGELFDYNGGGRTLVNQTMAKVYLRSYFSSPWVDISMLPVQDIVAATRIEYNDATHKYDIRLRNNFANTDQPLSSYDTQEDAVFFRELLIGLYTICQTGEERECVFPDNGLGYLRDDILSLKLKAEKPINGDPQQGYYPIQQNTLIRNRGVYDKFYAAWFDFLTNSSLAILEVTLEPSAWQLLRTHANTDFLRIGNHLGLLKSATAETTDDGRLRAKLTLMHL